MLDDEVAILTEPTPVAFAEGILAAFGDPARSRALGARAGARADAKYSYEAYLARTHEAVSRLSGAAATAAVPGSAA